MMMDMPANPHSSATPPAETPSARRAETRTRLLDAAIEVFAEEGLQGAAVEAICSRAGFTRGAFYSNFSSKEQLFLALLEREFERRARDLAEKAQMIEPSLRANSGCISPPEAANYIVEFFTPANDAIAWFALETEFLLLAMRDPDLAPEHHAFMDRFYASIAGAVEHVIEAAGRRFSIPAAHAMPVLSSVYEQALRAAALRGGAFGAGAVPAGQGSAAPPIAFAEFGDRLAELLFALTEPSGANDSAR